MPKISVLMPIYNAEAFLDECINSVINQTFTDFEVICVDDGSQDSTGKMLDEYASRDQRISVIHKENTGYGHSMNLAISRANAAYIMFVEPDDTIQADMLELLYNAVSKNEQNDPIDMVRANYNLLTNHTDLEPFEPFDKKSICGKTIKPTNYLQVFQSAGNIWTGIYRKEFLNKNAIRFLETPGASFQDIGFNFRATIESQKAIYIREYLYNYRTDNQASSVKTPKNLFSVTTEYSALQKIYGSDKIKNKILNSQLMIIYLWNYERLNQDGKEQFLPEMQRLKEIINNNDYCLSIVTNSKLKKILKILNLEYTLKNRISSLVLKLRAKFFSR